MTDIEEKGKSSSTSIELTERFEQKKDDGNCSIMEQLTLFGAKKRKPNDKTVSINEVNDNKATDKKGSK
ncbi:hypothetical protein C4J81_16480 [Deltaproteobacteria bacterium Smac51]|nr:hypothetical protein C4J81_16480 [Deltaproteobacteria bacterium Smac51]